MPIQNESPYVSHVFVCTNDRGGERKSCADNNSPLIKAKLKDVHIRMHGALCQGLQCDDLPPEDMVF